MFSVLSDYASYLWAYLTEMLVECPIPRRLEVASEDDLKTVDCAYFQAMGRGSIIDEDLPIFLGYCTKQAYERGVDICQILEEKKIIPGLSNISLAKVAISLHEKYDLHLILQWEVGYSIYLLDRKWYLENLDTIHPLMPTASYYPTKVVKEDSISVRLGLEALFEKKFRVVEVAAREMISRASAILWNLGEEHLVYPVNVEYDPASIQKWTRSREKFREYEFKARVHHLIFRWVTFNAPK